jgi:hypothetical protein
MQQSRQNGSNLLIKLQNEANIEERASWRKSHAAVKKYLVGEGSIRRILSPNLNEKRSWEEEGAGV